jgi:VWFA-related protein
MSRAAAVTLIGLGLAGGIMGAQSTSERPSRPTFRVGVDFVSLNVTVTDGARRFIRDLDRSDFVVLENGRRQVVTYFSRTALPLALVLLIDSSASMEDKLATAQEAAVGFVRQLQPRRGDRGGPGRWTA